MASPSTSAVAENPPRGRFNSRRVFILAAIGSAVGLGNIWRFPYVAYENGGGSFIVPYLFALLCAGIPFLLFDYALGHKYRGSAPLTFRRLARKAEFLGWWQVAVCFIIAVYYAAVLAWAASYTVLSFNKGWGANPEEYFFGDYLQAGDPGVSLDLVPNVAIPLGLMWLVVAIVMVLGVQRGVGMLSVIFIPLLVLAFGALVVQSLFLPGAVTGLNALFTPDWSALTHPGVWGAALGQIFFSLSIGFGIMITYSSYVDRDTDMTGSGLVVGFSNSSFELLAGIGVFAALGFMAQASGVAVDEVVTAGIGLAFIAFPAIINEAPGGTLIGILFFSSLVIAGLTSLVSVLEVVVSAVRDKFELTRIAASLAVVVPAALISMLMFSTASGIFVLDITDHFVNNFGILLVAVVSIVVVAWLVRALPRLADHLNVFGAMKIGPIWRILLGVVTPIALSVVLVQQFLQVVREPYEGYPAWMLGTFGWGMAAALIVFSVLASLVSWRPQTSMTEPSADPTENKAVS